MDFGLVIGVFFLIISVVTFWLGTNWGLYLWLAIFFIAASLIFPPMLLPFQKVWMAFSVVMGYITSNLILVILFYVIVTPLGLVMRIFKKDLLDLKIENSRASYWHKRAVTDFKKQDYERQF